MEASPPLVQIINCWKSYKMGSGYVVALKGIHLSIQAGEVVALMGPSGSGKSTLLHLMGAMDTITRGQIILDGMNLKGASEPELSLIRQTKVGFVFQSGRLIPALTALENVELPLLFRATHRQKLRQRATELLTQVGLSERLTHKPAQLSGGQQQRVSIARALITEPRLILADEPTANLDAKTSQEILTLLTDLNRKTAVTLVIATHDPRVAAIASRVVTLADGQIGLPGSP